MSSFAGDALPLAAVSRRSGVVETGRATHAGGCFNLGEVSWGKIAVEM
jgi:hypothetical protein